MWLKSPVEDRLGEARALMIRARSIEPLVEIDALDRTVTMEIYSDEYLTIENRSSRASCSLWLRSNTVLTAMSPVTALEDPGVRTMVISSASRPSASIIEADLIVPTVPLAR